MKSYNIKIKILELESDGYHVITKIKIEKKVLHFIVDTGATHTCMDQNNFTSLQPEEPVMEHDGDSVGIAASGFKTAITIFRNFKIGRMLIPEQRVILLDMSHVNQVYEMLKKTKIDGILGCDFLVKYNALIDFKAKKMKLWKNS